MKTHLELAQYFLDDTLPWVTGGDDTQYLFLNDNSENILLFAPSNSKIDWKNNFNFWKKPYKQMKVKFYVHGGFLKCWKLVRDEILRYIKDAKLDNLTIVGWSYGGAMATLCTEDIWYHFPDLRDNTRTITFGAPKAISIIGYNRVIDRFQNMTMYKNGSDIVTKVPFNWMGFKHVSRLTKIGEKPKFLKYFRPYFYHSMLFKDIYGYIPNLKDAPQETSEKGGLNV